MKLLFLSLLISLPAFAGESSALLLRARVPAVYSVEITPNGSLVTHSNLARRAPKPKIIQSEKNGIRLVTVTHP